MTDKESPSHPSMFDHVADKQSLTDTYLRKFFEAAWKYEASDLLLRGGDVPRLRLRGELKSLETESLDPNDFDQAIEVSLTNAQWEYYTRHGSIDLGIDLNASTRFRANVFRTRGRSAIVARRINSTILDYEDLNLPQIFRNISEAQQGLILVCGVTGSGKSTSIAAMIQQINLTRACHILTIEDPIEFLFTEAKAIINQREVGIDVPDFAEGLKVMVREDPDVILIGEMRDRETFEASLQAAETGHLVLGTIHASTTSQAFGRIYDMFPADERSPIRNLLAYQMRAFICQRLLPSLQPDIQRVPAVEVLLQAPPTRKYILEGREHELETVIRDGQQAGMQTFTDSLMELVEKEYIHPRDAQAGAANPEEIRMRLKGIKAE